MDSNFVTTAAWYMMQEISKKVILSKLKFAKIEK
jgi:hypothetical protein